MKLILLTPLLVLQFTLFATSAKSATDDAEKKHGKDLFHLCAACHGQNGEGIKSQNAPAIAGMQDWYLLNQISKFRNGGRGLHHLDAGGLRMRPMARTLNNDADIKAVISYVSSMPAPAIATTIVGQPLDGKKAFEMTCVACHGPDAKGLQAMNAPSLVQTNDWYLVTQLNLFKNKIRGYNPALDPIGSTMAPMAMMLDEQKMKDIVFYIQSLR